MRLYVINHLTGPNPSLSLTFSTKRVSCQPHLPGLLPSGIVSSLSGCPALLFVLLRILIEMFFAVAPLVGSSWTGTYLAG
jgi:hypothetical protein